MEIFFGKVSWNLTVFENFQYSDWLIQWSHDLKWDFERFQAYLKLLEVMAPYRTLFDTIWNFLIPYLKLFLFWDFCYLNMQLIWCLDFTEVRCVSWRLRHYVELFDSLIETFVIWNFLWKLSILKWNFFIFYLKLLLNETFWYIKRHFCWIKNNKHEWLQKINISTENKQK